MIYNLTISNKYIYIDDIRILSFLSIWNKYEVKYNLKVYIIQNIVFCNITGILKVYLTNNKIYKLVFISFNAINIYNIPKINIDFADTISKLKDTLKKNYRSKSDTVYYNKKFEFKLTYSINNFSILIAPRDKELFINNRKGN